MKLPSIRWKIFENTIGCTWYLFTSLSMGWTSGIWWAAVYIRVARRLFILTEWRTVYLNDPVFSYRQFITPVQEISMCLVISFPNMKKKIRQKIQKKNIYRCGNLAKSEILAYLADLLKKKSTVSILQQN